MKSLLSDLKQSHYHLSLLLCDNTATLHIAAKPVFHERIKHIELNYHIIRDNVQAKELTTLHVPSFHQVADLLTKPLDLLNSTHYCPR